MPRHIAKCNPYAAGPHIRSFHPRTYVHGSLSQLEVPPPPPPARGREQHSAYNLRKLDVSTRAESLVYKLGEPCVLMDV